MHKFKFKGMKTFLFEFARYKKLRYDAEELGGSPCDGLDGSCPAARRKIPDRKFSSDEMYNLCLEQKKKGEAPIYLTADIKGNRSMRESCGEKMEMTRKTITHHPNRFPE
jgi:hypothetical protein